jgi:uncharacterized membrane protein
MNWLLASTLMFISSIVLYLFIRKSSLLKIPSQFQNLAMFAIPLFVYLGILVTTKTNLFVSPYQLIILMIAAFFFSYLGNVFSLKSIEYAPNPGYSLVLSKSYVVFTSLAAIPLFHATLSLKSAFAIVLIVIFSALVMITKKKESKEHVRPLWLPLAIGAFFCWGMLSLASKYLLTIGVLIIPRLIYSMSLVTVFIMGEMKINKVPWKNLSKNQWFILLAIGLASAAFNYFMQLGINTAPNIGYVNAINASSIAAVTIFSALFFKDELTKRKLIGVIGVTIGLILLVL